MGKRITKHGAWLLAIGVVAATAMGLAGRPGRAAESAAELRQKNEELRQILENFGKGNVDVHLVEELGDGESSLTNVTPLRPTSVFGKPFFRFRDARGDVFLVSPGHILAIRVPGGGER
jgi:hypothetical protein